MSDKMRRALLLLGLALWLAAGVPLAGQQPPPLDPILYRKPAKSTTKAAAQLAPPSLALPLAAPLEAKLPELTEAEKLRVRPLEGDEPIGVHRNPPAEFEPTPEGMRVWGAWTVTPDGRRLWRAAIRSPGAVGLRLHFRNVELGGGRLWIHSGDEQNPQTLGPYQAAGPEGDGEFWSRTIFGERAVLEYQPDATEPAAEVAPFRVVEISHLWRLFEAAPAAAAKRSQASSCQVDVACGGLEWRDTASSVARIVFEEDGGSFVCSGTLLNNRAQDFTPLLLTAAHCLSDETTARSVEAYWFFESASCGAPAPDARSVPRTSGAQLLETLGEFGDPKGDFTLLLLDEIPDNVLFSGWETAAARYGETVTGIHHPRGTAKRISRGDVTPDRSFDTSPESYAVVQLTEGRIETGSSGSGLFRSPGRLVGALSFGLKVPEGRNACDLDPFFAGYGQFSAFYPSIRSYLEGVAPPPTPPPAEEPDLLIPGSPEPLALPAVDAATLFRGDYSYRIEVPDDATALRVALETETPAVDVDLYVRHGQDVELSGNEVVADFSSEGLDGDELIVIDGFSDPPLRPGVYYIAFGLITPGRAVNATVTATVERTDLGPPEGRQLTPGQSERFTLPRVERPTLFGGSSSFRVEVPASATRLDVELLSDAVGVDVDLHVRFGQPPDSVGGEIVAEASSTGLNGDEFVTLTPETGLRPGTWYIAMALYTENTAVRGTLRADIAEGQAVEPEVIPLAPGESQEFSLPAVNSPTLFPSPLFRIDVPAGVSRIALDLEADVDVDLYLRLGAPPERRNGEVTANYSSEGPDGDEQITLSADSQPPLQAGTYYAALLLYETGAPATGRIRLEADELRLDSIVHAATFSAGPVAPGEIVTIFGSGLTPPDPQQPRLGDNGQLQTYVSDVVVLFDGAPAPLFFLSPTQINLQVPYTVAGQTTTRVTVVQDGRTSNALTAPVAPTQPDFFRLPSDPGQAIAINQDGSLNSPERPARRGDYVTLYATGEGLRTSGNAAGRPAAIPFPEPLAPAELRIGGEVAAYDYLGAAPGFVGLLQINAVVPATAAAGARVPVTLRIGEASTSAAFIAVE